MKGHSTLGIGHAANYHRWIVSPRGRDDGGRSQEQGGQDGEAAILEGFHVYSKKVTVF
jgi:hypothetical protein